METKKKDLTIFDIIFTNKKSKTYNEAVESLTRVKDIITNTTMDFPDVSSKDIQTLKNKWTELEDPIGNGIHTMGLHKGKDYKSLLVHHQENSFSAQHFHSKEWEVITILDGQCYDKTTNTKLNNNKSNYIKIGIPAGSTRASTGYTFLNIQKQADEYMKMLNGKSFIEHPKTFKNKILRKMDNLLLMIIKDHPTESKNILFEMFNRNQAQRVIRFLSDTPSLMDIILIIWNMPKLLFIKYAIRSFTTPKI